MNYKELNKATIKDNFPLPFIDQVLVSFSGEKYFSFLDRLVGTLKFKLGERNKINNIHLSLGDLCLQVLPLGLV
jgi:hypothetical protein